MIHSDAFAGVERHVARLAGAQAARGDQVVVIGGDQTRMREESSAGVVHRPAPTAWQTLRAVRAAARGRSDVVHAHMTTAEAVSVVATLGTGIPVVTTRHFGRPRGSTTRAKRVMRLLATRILAQIAISEYVAALVEGPCVVVHPGVPVQPDSRPAVERDRTVLVVQRLEPEKATDDAIRLFALSGLAQLGWRLEIAGSGTELAKLTRLATEQGVGESTAFLGHRADVAELMRTSAVLVAPCPVEGLGLTVVEAMSAGLPIVAAGSGGHLETLKGLPGTLLYESTERGMARAASGLSRLALDEGLREVAAGELQQAQRERFTLDRQARDTEAVYRSVL